MCKNTRSMPPWLRLKNSIISDEKLALSVSKYSVLYGKSCTELKKRLKKELAWNAVANEVELTMGNTLYRRQVTVAILLPNYGNQLEVSLSKDFSHSSVQWKRRLKIKICAIVCRSRLSHLICILQQCWRITLPWQEPMVRSTQLPYEANVKAYLHTDRFFIFSFVKRQFRLSDAMASNWFLAIGHGAPTGVLSMRNSFWK